MKSAGADLPTKRSRTNIPGFDDILNGGFIPHRLYLVDGNPGAGKTTLGLQYLSAGIAQARNACTSPCRKPGRNSWRGPPSHGWSLDGIEIVELIADQKDLDDETQVTMYLPSEIELNETTKKILEAVERGNPRGSCSIRSRKCGCWPRIRSAIAGRFWR